MACLNMSPDRQLANQTAPPQTVPSISVAAASTQTDEPVSGLGLRALSELGFDDDALCKQVTERVAEVMLSVEIGCFRCLS